MTDPNSPELPPIVEARKAPRKRVVLGAKVVYNEGGFSVDCRIRDLSDGGARIVLAKGAFIPTRVVLIDTRNGIAYESEVVWLKAPEFGLKFLATYSIRGALPPQLQYLKRYNTVY
ncbi:MAG: PilZ domain-containing protein [bacterium]